MDTEVSKRNRKEIIVTGFPYAFPYYFRVFDFFEKKSNLVFVLPEFWWAKDGKIQLPLPPREGFTQYGLRAWSYGGKSFLKGIFKGWLPGLLMALPKIKMRYGSRVMYSCSEPHLLTTLFNNLLANLCGLKHVLFTWQNIPPEDRMRGIKLHLSNTLVRLNLWLADGIICGNKKAELIIKHFNANIQTVVCPLSGVDIERFSLGGSSLKERLNIDAQVILFTGALDNRKGIETLIQAHAQLQDLSHLVIIGTGPKKQELLNLVEEAGTKERVHFLDWMKNEELPDILRGADVFAYPSVARGGWEEQFGYAMAEASACGVPVISTRTGSIDEVVLDGKTGILVPPSDAAELSGALRRILGNTDEGKALGLAGRDYIERTYSQKIVAQKIETFLQSFL